MPRPKVLPIDVATERLTAAEQVLERWTGEAASQAHEAQVLAVELVEAQERAADDLLDYEEAETEAARVAQIQRALSDKQDAQKLAVRAAERATQRLSDARRVVLTARGGVLRSRAEALQLKAASRQARTDQMLAEIAQFEGVDYAPAVRYRDPSLPGAGIVPRSLTQRLQMRAQWLVTHAAGLEGLAVDGSADQVASNVAAGMPPLDDTEIAVAEPVNTPV